MCAVLCLKVELCASSLLRFVELRKRGGSRLVVASLSCRAQPRQNADAVPCWPPRPSPAASAQAGRPCGIHFYCGNIREPSAVGGVRASPRPRGPDEFASGDRDLTVGCSSFPLSQLILLPSCCCCFSQQLPPGTCIAPTPTLSVPCPGVP